MSGRDVDLWLRLRNAFDEPPFDFGDLTLDALAEAAVEAIEQQRADPGTDIHTWFELTYASYLTINRSLLQSMPMEWQYKFTALLSQLREEFIDVDEPRYTIAARDRNGRFIKDPIPHYNRGRTFVKGQTNVHPFRDYQ